MVRVNLPENFVDPTAWRGIDSPTPPRAKKRSGPILQRKIDPDRCTRRLRRAHFNDGWTIGATLTPAEICATAGRSAIGTMPPMTP